MSVPRLVLKMLKLECVRSSCVVCSFVKRVVNAGVASVTFYVCLQCWVWLHNAILEVSAHTILQCPCYAEARCSFLQALDPNTLQKLNVAQLPLEQLKVIFCSRNPSDWSALGKFLSSVRTRRKHTRRLLDELTARLTRDQFAVRKVAWRSSGRAVCRHGMFFRTRQTTCYCRNPSSEAFLATCRNIM